MELTVQDVYRAYHPGLRRFVQGRVADSGAADDVLQEVYLRIHARLASVRDPARLQGWVYQIARHAIIDYYRSRRSAAQLPESLPLPEDVCENDFECDLMASLPSIIDSLPDRYRQALTLTLYEGLTQQEVAERLGISWSGAKSRVQRARDKIKEMMSECCDFAYDRYGSILGYQPRCC